MQTHFHTEQIEKAAWILKLIQQLMNDGFDGTLLLDFQKGNISKKYRKQEVGYANELN